MSFSALAAFRQQKTLTVNSAFTPLNDYFSARAIAGNDTLGFW
jgi:hypothetical protein